MQKKEMIIKISEISGIYQKDVDKVVSLYLELIKDEIKTNKKCSITNFGTFRLNKTRPMQIYSPYDGRTIKKDAQLRVNFKASSAFKKKLNEE